MKKLSFRFLYFILVIPLWSQAQEDMSGYVGSTKGAVAFATVKVSGTSHGAITDENGLFNIKNIPDDSFQLIVSAIGYREIRFEVERPLDASTEIFLTEDLLSLEEVVVSGTRYALDRKESPVIVSVLDNKLLTSTQSIAISDGLSYQPGVRVETNCQNCGFTQVRLNGLEGAYSQILINSRAVFSALNSVYGLDQIPANMVKQVEVVRSGGSALYGSNAIAGTVNIVTQDPVESSWEISSNTAMIDAKALDQTVSFNGSVIDQDLKSGATFYGMFRDRGHYDANDDGFTEMVQLNHNILGLKAFLRPGESSKLTMDFSGIREYRRGGDRLSLAPHFTDITEELDHKTVFAGTTFDFWTKDDRNQFSLYTSTQWTDRGSYYGGLGGGRTSADSIAAANAYGATDDMAWVSGFQYLGNLNNGDVLTAGVENQFNSTQDEIQGYSREVDQKVNAIGVYGQYEWKPTDKFKALLGARYDVTSVRGSYQLEDINSEVNIDLGVFSPRLTLMYNLTRAVQLRGGYARGFRAPQAFNEDLHISSVGGEPQFVVLAEDLEHEMSDAFTGSINVSQDFGTAQTNILIEGFYTQLENPFTQVSTGSVLANGSIVEEVRNGEGASVSGINLEAAVSTSPRFAFQMGGTLQTSSYTDEQVLFEPEEGANSENVVSIQEFLRTPNLYGYFTTNWYVAKSWQFDLTGTYTGPMVVSRVVSDTGFMDLVDTDSFYDINLKASYHFEILDGLHLELSGGVKNVLNSYQSDFDSGALRDSNYIYGPSSPRSFFISIKLGNIH